MKKLLALAMAASLLPAVAMAKGNHPMAGCGLAYVLFSKDNNDKGIQILASTTNNLAGSQSFGITSGTMGCTKDGRMMASAETEVFVDVNFKDLSREMAAGQGEYLGTLANLLNVKAEKKGEFFSFVQEKYAVLFPAAETSSTEMLNALTEELSHRQDLLS